MSAYNLMAIHLIVVETVQYGPWWTEQQRDFAIHRAIPLGWITTTFLDKCIFLRYPHT